MVILQYAIDVTDQEHALELARQAVANGVSWIEAGHVLIKAAGIEVVSNLKALNPTGVTVADMKTMDMGGEEVELAAKAGADLVMVCAAASDGTVRAAISAARRCRVQVTASLMGVRDKYERACEIDAMAPDFILAHKGIDEHFDWFDAEHSRMLKRMVADLKTPLGIAGGLNESNYPKLKGLGFAMVISGRGITEAPDPGVAAGRLVQLVANSMGS